MSIRDDILAGLRASEDTMVGDATPEQVLDAYRDEVLREHAAEKQSEREEAETDQAYRASAAARIWSRLCYPPLGRNCTETYADRLLRRLRAEVLREAADKLVAKYGVTNRAAGDLRRMADADEAGEGVE
ncbi:hypothetical protein ABZ791_30450 [Streptomyces huasconensis]|uniref:Uncharacterized protein n=1 Tax=Streptomyces huasconensis TaxID=1854574 RepID=A0ABV3M1R9_9ACTN